MAIPAKSNQKFFEDLLASVDKIRQMEICPASQLRAIRLVLETEFGETTDKILEAAELLEHDPSDETLLKLAGYDPEEI